MEYKKYELLPYHLHVISSKKFKTVAVKFNFKRPLMKDEITIRNLLGDVMIESTELYPNRRLMEIATENLYGISCSVNNYASGKYQILSFSTDFLSEKYTEPGMVKKSLQFLMNIICKPNLEGEQFTMNSFLNCKAGLDDAIASYDESPYRYASKRLHQAMDAEAPYAYVPCGTKGDLDQITPELLYQYYQSVLKSDIVDIFVCGDVNGDEIKNFFLEECGIKTIKKPGESHIYQHTKFRKRAKIVKEERAIGQSILKLGYKLDHPTEFERKYVIGLFNHILGVSGNSRLFQNVREKHSLCYNISSNFSGIENLLTITAGIDRENFKKTADLIRKEVKRLCTGDVSDKEIEQYITVALSNYKQIEDTPYDLIRLLHSEVYLNSDSLETREKEVLKLTKEMLTKFAQKVRLDTIYLLEGMGFDGNN